ncbi:MAG: hypothetical protein ABIO78_00985 [Thermoanaerobaculia bacterium]
MIPWVLLGSAKVPGDDGEMRLYQRGSEFSIRVDHYELMNSRGHGSEDALGTLAAERIRGRSRARVLVGGLGMGFTAAALLKNLENGGEVVVAELVPDVVVWNHGPLGAVAEHPLADPRLTVREADVAQVIRTERGAWDAILLDVDNGPAGMTTDANDWLYSLDGLRASFAALRPAGVFAVWSSGDDASFTKRMKQAGFVTEQIRVRDRGSAGARYLIWIGSRIK